MSCLQHILLGSEEVSRRSLKWAVVLFVVVRSQPAPRLSLGLNSSNNTKETQRLATHHFIYLEAINPIATFFLSSSEICYDWRRNPSFCIMDYLKRFIDKRDRALIPSVEYSDKEPSAAPSEENDEDETLLYPQRKLSQSRRKRWTRYICTSALVISTMVCCFAGGFLLKGATQPRVWNFDHYDIRR